MIAHIDKAWGNANKEFVNTLVRDFANPSAKDGFFTMYRNFDWYHGHSWAHGLYDTLDGNVSCLFFFLLCRLHCSSLVAVPL